MTISREGLRILFITPPPRAGTLQYTHNLANALVQRGHRVTLVTGMGFELADYPRSYEALEVFDRYRPRPLRLCRFLWHCLTFRPQIIHLQGAQHPAAYILLWAMLRLFSNASFVYSPHDVWSNSPRSYHIRAFRFFYARMRHVFMMAKRNAELVIEYFHVPRERITVVPLGDNTAFAREDITAEFPEIPPGKKVVLCFGLIEPRKGIGTLVSAAPEVLRQVPNALLMIVGKPLMDIAPLQRQLTELGLQECVRLVPRYVSFAQMAGYFTAARLLVLPYEEGWNSGVIASAFGFGKPVITTQVGGFAEVVTHESTGLLVPPKDPAALAQAIVRLLSDEMLYGRMVTNVQQAAREISWEVTARITEDRYADVLGIGADCAVSQARQH